MRARVRVVSVVSENNTKNPFSGIRRCRAPGETTTPVPPVINPVMRLVLGHVNNKLLQDYPDGGRVARATSDYAV